MNVYKRFLETFCSADGSFTIMVAGPAMSGAVGLQPVRGFYHATDGVVVAGRKK
jgi:hypothetical protein